MDLSALQERIPPVNVGKEERIASAAAGALLTVWAWRRRSLPGVALGLAGLALIARGASGRCSLYAGRADVEPEDGRFVEAPGSQATTETITRTTTIAQPRDEVYAFWREVDHLPCFWAGLKSITPEDGITYRCVSAGPDGQEIAWQARLTRDVAGKEIAWESLPGSPLKIAGQVEFADAPAGRGTEVRVQITLEAPSGAAGFLAGAGGAELPEQQLAESLRRLKQVLEAGQRPTLEGQPRGGD